MRDPLAGFPEGNQRADLSSQSHWRENQPGAVPRLHRWDYAVVFRRLQAQTTTEATPMPSRAMELGSGTGIAMKL